MQSCSELLILTIIARSKKHKETGNFQAAFFVPVGLRHAHMSMRSFIGIDSTHTSSRFRMTLLIAGSIDANSETLPLA